MLRSVPLLVALLAFASPALAVDGESEPKRTPVLVVEAPKSASVKDAKKADDAAARSLVRALEPFRSFELRSTTWKSLTRDDLDRARVVVLTEARRDDGSEMLDELRQAVYGGLGLVVYADATRSWPESVAYANLIGRRLLRGPDGAASTPERKPEGEVVVAVHDQRHPITQCVTHFVHRVDARPVELADGVVAQASSVPVTKGSGRPSRAGHLHPVLWSRAYGRGRIAASRLDCSDGPSRDGPSRDLARVLLARAIQWSAREPIRVPIAGDKIRWAAAGLGPKDTGILPGSGVEEGFFRGRQIARFMTYHGASWLVRPDREAAEEPDRVLESLEIAPGSTVADLGAGNGYFTLRMARRVGEKGKVLAVDIQKEMLALLDARRKEAGFDNIDLVLATETDPKLPAGAVDLVLFVDVYHELSRPGEVMAAVRKSLAPKGRVVLVEYRGEDPTIAIKPLHRMTEAQARAELEAQGFEWLETKRFLKQQHVLVFGRKG